MKDRWQTHVTHQGDPARTQLPALQCPGCTALSAPFREKTTGSLGTYCGEKPVTVPFYLPMLSLSLHQCRPLLTNISQDKVTQTELQPGGCLPTCGSSIAIGEGLEGCVLCVCACTCDVVPTCVCTCGGIFYLLLHPLETVFLSESGAHQFDRLAPV